MCEWDDYCLPYRTECRDICRNIGLDLLCRSPACGPDLLLQIGRIVLSALDRRKSWEGRSSLLLSLQATTRRGKWHGAASGDA